MEDSPLFNCARGSSVTMDGRVEMDAVRQKSAAAALSAALATATLAIASLVAVAAVPPC